MPRRVREEMLIQSCPVEELPQRPRDQAVEALPADRFGLDESCVQKDPQVLRHRGLGHVEWAGEIGHRPIAIAQPVEHRPARRIGNRAKHVRGCHVHAGDSNKQMLICQRRRGAVNPPLPPPLSLPVFPSVPILEPDHIV